jgi:hypothetical protein
MACVCASTDVLNLTKAEPYIRGVQGGWLPVAATAVAVTYLVASWYSKVDNGQIRTTNQSSFTFPSKPESANHRT